VASDIIAQTYLGRSSRTIETVRFTPVERIDFRTVRGPVSHVVEQFVLSEQDLGSCVEYRGELGVVSSARAQRPGRR
jgi:hypothetical protein